MINIKLERTNAKKKRDEGPDKILAKAFQSHLDKLAKLLGIM